MTALAVAIALGCGGRSLREVEVDLTAPGRCVSSRGAPQPVAGPALVHESGGVVDCYLQLPARSEVVFDVTPAVARDAFDVTLLPPRGPERGLWLTRRNGEWRGQIGWPPGEPVRLRFVSRRVDRLTWLRPRVVGVLRPAPPPLDARARPPAGGRPNVLLYVVDTLRADRLGAYGHSRPTSPNLDALAASGALFLHAYAPGPNTMATIPTLLASRHPWEVGGHLRRSRDLPTRTLAEAFQAAGYRTAAFQANFLLAGPLGLGRGFDTYSVVRATAPPGPAPAALLHAHVLEWIRREPGRPFFVFVQSFDVHGYDVVPPPFAGRFSAGAAPVVVPPDVTPVTRAMIERMHPARYDEAVAYTDHEIGRLMASLEALGLRGNTAVVVTADHGESLGEGGGRRYLHGHSLAEELLHVPLIFSLPWLSTSVRVTDTVGLIRVAPTLLDLAGIPQPPEFAGRSLLEVEHAEEPPAAFGARLLNLGAPEATEVEWYIREGPWKLRADRARLRLFDVSRDPEETTDRSTDEAVRAAYMATRLGRAFQRADTSARARALHEELDAPQREELERSLRALGYIE